jgi:hypothetical protein
LVELDVDLLDRMRAEYPRELPQRKHAILHERLASTAEKGWAILAEDELCGYCHVAIADVRNERINHRVRLRPGQAYFVDDYTVKQHRGRGLHTFTIARRCQLLTAMGFTEGVVTVTRSNRASRASYAKFGARVRALLVHSPVLRRTVEVPLRWQPRRG